MYIRTKTALNFLGLEPGASQSQIQEAIEPLYFKHCDPSLPESAPMRFLFNEIARTLLGYKGGEVRGFKAQKDTLEAMRATCAWLVENDKVFLFKGSWIHVEDSELNPSDWDEARKLGFKPRTANRSTWAFHVKGDESRGRGGFSSSEIDSKYGSHVVDYSTDRLEKKLKKKRQQEEEEDRDSDAA